MEEDQQRRTNTQQIVTPAQWVSDLAATDNNYSAAYAASDRDLTEDSHATTARDVLNIHSISSPPPIEHPSIKVCPRANRQHDG